MAKRNLTDDEKKLWRRVTENISSLKPEKTKVTAEDHFQITVPEKTKSAKIKPGIKNELHHISFSGINSPLNQPPLNQQNAEKSPPLAPEHNWQQRIKRDKARIEAKIDLHGMTQEKAYAALYDFIFRAQAQGKRLLLVITGKGRSKKGTDRGFENLYEGSRGILKSQVPRWLSQGEFRPLILSVSPARLKHGGEGALYVILKRQR